MRALLTLPLALFLLSSACAPKDEPIPDDEKPSVTETKIVVRFKISDGVRGQLKKDSLIKGTAYGDFFLSEDVTLTGPRKGALAAASLDLPIDLKTDKLSAASWIRFSRSVFRFPLSSAPCARPRTMPMSSSTSDTSSPETVAFA